MKQFEYQVEIKGLEDIEQVVYFCNSEGECSPQTVPTDQVEMFSRICGQRGEEGWELVQANFSSSGVMLIWKREKP